MRILARLLFIVALLAVLSRAGTCPAGNVISADGANSVGYLQNPTPFNGVDVYASSSCGWTLRWTKSAGATLNLQGLVYNVSCDSQLMVQCNDASGVTLLTRGCETTPALSVSSTTCDMYVTFTPGATTPAKSGFNIEYEVILPLGPGMPPPPPPPPKTAAQTAIIIIACVLCVGIFGAIIFFWIRSCKRFDDKKKADAETREKKFKKFFGFGDPEPKPAPAPAPAPAPVVAAAPAPAPQVIYVQGPPPGQQPVYMAQPQPYAGQPQPYAGQPMPGQPIYAAAPAPGYAAPPPGYAAPAAAPPPGYYAPPAGAPMPGPPPAAAGGFCPMCGSAMPGGARFCPTCGATH